MRKSPGLRAAEGDEAPPRYSYHYWLVKQTFPLFRRERPMVRTGKKEENKPPPDPISVRQLHATGFLP